MDSPGKKTFTATEQSEAQLLAFFAAIAKLDVERLLFLDETGTNLAMTRLYARAPRGQRALDKRPKDRGRIHTVLSAMGLRGLVATWAFEGWLNKELFERFVREQLAPALRPGDVVVLDQLSSHKSALAKKLIEDAGATVLFLPRATPELNLGEHCWAKLKALIRMLAPRTTPDLFEAIRYAVSKVTSHDCWGWFDQCGYIVDS